MNKRILQVSLVAVLGASAGAWVLVARADRAEAGDQAETGGQQGQEDGLMAQRTKGDSAAPVVVYEVSDFQCPYCKMFFDETLEALDREYIQTGKVKLVFLNLPIPQLHANAPAAHEMAMCAAKQDEFWAMHDLLFRNQQGWERLSEPRSFFIGLADSVGLNRHELDTCLDTGQVRWLIEQEAMTIARMGVSSTPSFIIEGGLLKGAVPIETWRPILDSIVTAKNGS